MAKTVLDVLQEQINDREHYLIMNVLASGCVGSMEHYKHVTGEIQGLRTVNSFISDLANQLENDDD